MVARARGADFELLRCLLPGDPVRVLLRVELCVVERKVAPGAPAPPLGRGIATPPPNKNMQNLLWFAPLKGLLKPRPT